MIKGALGDTSRPGPTFAKTRKSPSKTPKPETALSNFRLFQHFRFHRLSEPRFKHSKAGFLITVGYVDRMTSNTRKIGILNEIPTTRAQKMAKPATRDISQSPKFRTI